MSEMSYRFLCLSCTNEFSQQYSRYFSRETVENVYAQMIGMRLINQDILVIFASAHTSGAACACVDEIFLEDDGIYVTLDYKNDPYGLAFERLPQDLLCLSVICTGMWILPDGIDLKLQHLLLDTKPAKQR